MADHQTLDNKINRAAFWAAVILIVSGILSLFLPLDAPEGAFAERMIWYSTNLGSFVFGWSVQMVAMLTLSGVFAAIAWQTRTTHPLSSFIAGAVLLVSVNAFLIPKFIAIWSIPQMVTASTTVSADAAVAEQLFTLLNPSLSFSLFTSFDYLGFWMYAIFGLLVAAPLFRLTMSARIAAVAFGLFGFFYHILLFGVMLGVIPSKEIGSYAGALGLMLLVPVVAMVFYFRARMKA